VTDILIRVYEVILVAYLVLWPAAIICVIVAFYQDVVRAIRRGDFDRIR
jgi:hypothetical protein